MVEEIKVDKQIKFLYTNFAKPAPSDIIEKASASFFNDQQSDIIKFYSDMNGLQIFCNY